MNDPIDDIIRREGGYVDHPADRGGPTKFGIMQKTLSAYRGRPVTADEVKALSEGEARKIYAEIYIADPGFDLIAEPALRGLVIDAAVNHGVKAATMMVQRAAGAVADGDFGPRSVAAVESGNPAVLYRRVLAARIRLYGDLITRDPKQAVFAKGWAERMAFFVEDSHGVV